MPSYYRKVDIRLWGDATWRQLSPLRPSGQALMIWLLTCNAGTPLPGVILSGRAAAAEALGWKQADFDAAWAELEAHKLAKADWSARLIYLPGAIKYNPPESPNVIRNWAKQWSLVPECSLKAQVWQEYKAFAEAFGEGFGEAFGEAFGEGMPESLALALALASTYKTLVPNSEAELGTPLRPDENEPADKWPTPQAVRQVFEHYCRAMGKTGRYRLTSARRSKIRQRLANCAPEIGVEALCRAIDACRASDFHQGANDAGKRYNDLSSNILKSEDKVEWWLERWEPAHSEWRQNED